MKKIALNLILAILVLLNTTASAQTPLWQGKGRIAMSSDGNEHDKDDWAATPFSLALLAAAGLQDRFILYTYSDHIWGSDIDQPVTSTNIGGYAQMKVSALGGKKLFGFNNTKFICAVDNPEVAYNAMRDVINQSSTDNPLIIIAAGPMQVEGEAIQRADKNKRQYVTIVTHSKWNNEHANKPEDKEPPHSGWTFKAICDSFATVQGGNLHPIQILDQNGGKDYDGLFTDINKFDWIKNSTIRNNKDYKPGSWNWLYTRLETCIKKKGTCFDASDSGMILYLLTGIEKTNPDLAKKIMENPQKRVKPVYEKFNAKLANYHSFIKI